MKVEKISELTTSRLSVYLRCLEELSASGVRTISSEELARKFRLNSAQIRKDLAYFGEFGVRGVGYYVDDLREHLRRILGLDKEHKVCIIGAGRLGTALADYNGFKKSNFSVVALFDIDESKIGKSIGNVKIYNFADFHKIVRLEKIEIAVITVPAYAAQQVLDEVVRAGIKAVLNFAPVTLIADASVKVKTVDLTTSLESLSYFLNQPVNGRDE
ncbi:MAG: redox-sensing transcriptional repressor Rex [Pyrinomonadaceae bacterium]|nr:redox-sensing transcriptional repressor Rex [Pyrinomonadaceae bacterium]MCX7639475.1 redox-sensing transcriptional repressor Rex [Pyrinomonadaceae bacterium]MDW8304474.1 redox-sensing transcriptional repressor Rex [Acidobacteriota bacterium]